MTRFELTAWVSLTNNTEADRAGYYFRVAHPLRDWPYQKILDLEIPEGHQHIKTWGTWPDPYVGFGVDIAAGETATRRVRWTIELKPITRLGVMQGPTQPEPSSAWLLPTSLIQSTDAGIIAKAEEVGDRDATVERNAEAFYEFSRDWVAIQDMSTNQGAVYALTQKKGDCTEHSTLFAALCRAFGIHAGITDAFLFDEETTERLYGPFPNHQQAWFWNPAYGGKIYVADPNLGTDEERYGWGFGFGKETVITLKHGNAGSFTYDEDSPQLPLAVEWALVRLS